MIAGTGRVVVGVAGTFLLIGGWVLFVASLELRPLAAWSLYASLVGAVMLGATFAHKENDTE